MYLLIAWATNVCSRLKRERERDYIITAVGFMKYMCQNFLCEALCAITLVIFSGTSAVQHTFGFIYFIGLC